MACQLDAKATAELLDGCLAHRVGNGTRPIEVGEYRTHQDDLAAAADHRFQRGSHRVDDSSDIDRHDTTHLVGGECAERTAPAEDTGVGNGDVDAPELLMGAAHRLPEGIELGDIAFQRHAVAVWERRRN